MKESQDVPSTSDVEIQERSSDALATDQEMKDVSEAAQDADKEARKRSPRKSYIRDVCDLPQTKMRALVAAAYPDTNVDEDALIALTKAAELFVMDVAKKAAATFPNKSHINYDEIATTVRAEKKKPYTFLRCKFSFIVYSVSHWNYKRTNFSHFTSHSTIRRSQETGNSSR